MRIRVPDSPVEPVRGVVLNSYLMDPDVQRMYQDLRLAGHDPAEYMDHLHRTAVGHEGLGMSENGIYPGLLPRLRHVGDHIQIGDNLYVQRQGANEFRVANRFQLLGPEGLQRRDSGHDSRE